MHRAPGYTGAEEFRVLKAILVTVGMIAVGVFVWRTLDRQGYGSSPTDDPGDPPSS
jgi:hypothetical protein